MDVWCDSISHLGLCFLNVWVWMKSTCKDNIWIGGKSVYNLNNVTLDVDLKCILVVQIYYRYFFFFFYKWFSYKQKYISFCLLGLVLGVALLHIAWRFHQTICSSNSAFFWQFLTFPGCSNNNKKKVCRWLCAGCLQKGVTLTNWHYLVLWII